MLRPFLTGLKFAALTALGLAALDVAFGFGLRFFATEVFFKSDARQMRENLRVTNNVMLRSDRDYPHPKRPDELVVGVFGGSFALAFSHTFTGIAIGSVPAAARFAERVGKPVRIENFALSGSSQPTQYNLLHLFHHQLDIAVFLDGYNEVMRPRDAAQPGGCKDMVAFWEQHRSSGPELLTPMSAGHAEVRALADSPLFPMLLQSGTFKLRLFRRSRELLQGVDTFYRTMSVEQATVDQPLSPITDGVDRWHDCVRLSSEYARAEDLPIHFFIQPNQYVRGSKPFSELEKRECFYSQGEVKPELWALLERQTETYRELDERATVLRASGIHADSLAHVFRGSPETLYVDKCCHINDLGNTVVAEAIFSKLLEALPQPGGSRPQ